MHDAFLGAPPLETIVDANEDDMAPITSDRIAEGAPPIIPHPAPTLREAFNSLAILDAPPHLRSYLLKNDAALDPTQCRACTFLTTDHDHIVVDATKAVLSKDKRQ